MDWSFWAVYAGGIGSGIALASLYWGLSEFRERRFRRRMHLAQEFGDMYLEREGEIAFVTTKRPLTPEDITRVYERVKEEDRVFDELQRHVGIRKDL